MSVRVVVDSSASLPAEVVQRLDIEVLGLHRLADDKAESTSGLGTLELVVAYARQLERGGDDGVVALHVAKQLSSTHQSAVAAAAVFDGAVDVVDTGTVGMAVGAAAMAAATRAQAGGSLAECAAAARETLHGSATWVYLPTVDSIRKSGRLSPGTALLSAALLAVKPILRIADGRFELAGKTRTATKAMARLVELVRSAAGGSPALVAIQHAHAATQAEHLRGVLSEQLPDGSTVLVTEMPAELIVHAGVGAVGVSLVRGEHHCG
ncbi:DegV family protein [Corynebacterium uterequi]|uniref:EDD domain protein, DegV family n=1 Tax=Corynebacterium uterequi TaxID=1072256 RepID=A0A0G3HFX0_9CORY|nr:DegV family protein [Corynebacterium uterequi]AKK11620.1 EDD domain protein, DegV family [Corynebacterium uterequi]